MAEKKNASFSGGGKNRIMLFIAIIVVSILVGIGFWQSKNKTPGPQASASVQEAPKIESTPGVGKAPPREYIKLQQQQNAQEVIEAQKKGTSAVPTIIRASYIGDDVTKGEAQDSVASKSGCDVASLRKARQAGVSAIELRCKGCSAAALRAAGYTAGELRDAGFTAEQLKASGFSSDELRAAGFNADELKVAGFDCKKLAGTKFTVAELKGKGCTLKDLIAAGFTAKQLRDAGFSAVDLKAAGFSAQDLAAAGFGSNESACDPKELKRQRDKGVFVATLRASGCSAAALRAAGYTAAELKEAGFSARELRDAGFSAKQLKAAGFSARDLKDAGYSAGELKNVGFSADELKDAGFSAAELRTAGFSAEDLKRAGFSAGELKGAGFSDGELIRAGVNVAATAPEGMGGATGIAPAAQVVSLNGGVSASGAQTDPAAAALERLQRMQAAQISDQERKQKFDQMRQGITSQATELLGSWAPPTPQQMVLGIESMQPAEAAGGAGMQGSSGPNAQTVAKVEMAPGTFTVIKAGTIMFGVLDVGINSDEQSPILASIVEGQLRGAKLMGQFTLQGQAKKVLVTFNLMNVPQLPNSVPVNAVAINPNTAHTMLADRVDSHYLLRYGTLFGSSFISGLADAVGKSGSSTVISPVGVTVSQPPLNTTKLVVTGLGAVGKQYSSSLGTNFQTPPTVYVEPGSSVGILFMTDLQVPKSPEAIVKQ